MEDMSLVIGAGGMIGSHLSERLLSDGREVVGNYFDPTVRVNELTPDLRLEELDVRDAKSVMDAFEKHKPKYVYHLAAQSYPTLSWEKPRETVEVNVVGTINIFETVRTLRVRDPHYDPVVVVACSSAEYGSSFLNASGPIPETAELLPLHPYGVTKVATDLLTYQYYMGYGIKGVRARIFNTSGPRKKGDVISDFARRIAALPPSGGQLVVGNLNTRRAFLHVDDTVDALLALAVKGVAGEVYNISGNRVVQISELLSMFESVSGKRVTCVVDDALVRPTDEPIIVGDNARILRDTGWQPSRIVDDVVRAVYDYELNSLRTMAG